MKREIRPWKRLRSRVLHKTFAFSLCENRVQSPDQSYEGDFYSIDATDWVNILPLTNRNHVVMVRQYRHGIEQPSLELPGGMLSGPEEDPLDGALRELEEETGYTAQRVEPLGYVHPNPAILNNRCYTFLATGVEENSGQNLDPAEDISVELIPLDRIPSLIESGEISSCLIVSAFYFYFASLARAV